MAIRAGSFVTAGDNPIVGRVTRVARDGSWADVRWLSPGPRGWSKRMGVGVLCEHVGDMYVAIRVEEVDDGE